MHTTSSRRGGATLAAAVLTASVVAFAPATPTAPTAPSAPELAVEHGEHGTTRTVVGLSDRLGFAPEDDLRDPLVWFERSRRVTEAHGLDTAAATDGECTEGCDEDGEVDAGETFVFSEATGDLDGDGTDDVLVLEVEFGEEGEEDITSSTTAHSGADGTVLWSVTEDGFAFALAVPDLDGDGATDLVTVSWSLAVLFDGGCATPLGLACDFDGTFQETVVLTGRRGADGAGIGSHRLDSSYRFAYDDASLGTPVGRSGTDEFRVIVEDGFFGVAVVDLDGDGTHQLAHESFDATFTQRTVGTINDTPFGFADAVATRTTEDLGGAIVVADLAAGTAAPVLEVTDALPFGWVAARPEGDRLVVDVLPEAGEVHGGCVVVHPVVGECGDDHDLPTSGANDAQATRTLYGADLQPVWEVALPPTSFFLYGAGADFTGDGVEELFDLRFDEQTFGDDVVAALDGATGADLWSAPASLVAVDGDRVLAGRVRFGEELAVDGLVLDAATGAVRAERDGIVAATLDGDGEEGTFTFASLGLALTDLTAGSTDLLADLHLAVHEVEEECGTFEDPEGPSEEYCWFTPGALLREEADLRAVEGSDLADLVHLQDPTFTLLGTAELDGDGRAELLGATLDREAFSVGAFRALRLDGSPLWELPAQSFLAGLLATPDGTQDVLAEEVAAGGTTRVAVRDGADLTERWSVGLPG